MEQKFRISGRPTGPDVDAIVEEFPVATLVPGWELDHDAVGKVIGENIKTYRFNTVTYRWRNKMRRNNNIIIASECGKFFVLNDSQKIGYSSNGIRSASKKLRKSAQIASIADSKNLTSDEIKTKSFIVNTVGSMIGIAQVERKKLSFTLENIEK
jgi:hypothetical protein